MNDVLPADIAAWQRLEARRARVVRVRTRYQEIRVPIVEHTALFKRSIGEFTDIVQKEMFTFEDPGGDSLTLRPEATAGIVRAMITQRPAAQSAPARLVRRARCSGTRSRSAAASGSSISSMSRRSAMPGPDIDAELIMLSARLLQALGVAARRAATSIRSARRSRGAPIAKSWSSTSRRTRRDSTPTVCGGSKAIRCAFSTARIRSCRT